MSPQGKTNTHARRAPESSMVNPHSFPPNCAAACGPLSTAVTVRDIKSNPVGLCGAYCSGPCAGDYHNPSKSDAVLLTCSLLSTASAFASLYSQPSRLRGPVLTACTISVPSALAQLSPWNTPVTPRLPIFLHRALPGCCRR